MRIRDGNVHLNKNICYVLVDSKNLFSLIQRLLDISVKIPILIEKYDDMNKIESADSIR